MKTVDLSQLTFQLMKQKESGIVVHGRDLTEEKKTFWIQLKKRKMIRKMKMKIEYHN